MPRLKICALGEPTLALNDRAVKLPTRKALALLMYLIAENKTHPRAHLADLFWAESDAATGRTALRVALANLKDALGENFLVIERETLAFDFASDFFYDVAELANAARQREAKLDVLRAALALARGEFLENFFLNDAPEFETWASAQREAAAQDLDVIYARVVQLDLEASAFDAAETTAARWARAHPLHEAAHYAWMQTRFAKNDRVGALHAFENLREVFARELKMKPAPETFALAEKIRASAPRATLLSPTTRRAPLDDFPMVGRADEFGALVTAFHALENSAASVFLVGEAGAGKSRLASEFLQYARVQGAEILEGRAFETGGSLPYQPLVNAFRKRLEKIHAPEDLWGDVWLAELTRVLPELRERYPDLPAPSADAALARGQLFEALTQFTLAFAQRAPLVFYLDDAQWADAATRDALLYIARRWQENNARGLFVCALRDEARGNSEIVAWMNDLQRALPMTTLEIGALTRDATTQLVHALTRADIGATAESEKFAAWLYAETNGQPFFVTETLKALLERGALALQRAANGAWYLDVTASPDALTLRGMIPAGVRQVLRARLTRLTEEPMAFLTAGAVLGQDSSFRVVMRVAALDQDAALRALDSLLQARLLRELDAGALSFTHDAVRQVVYEQTSATRRRVLHQRAFEELETRHAAPATLAHHARLAELRDAAFQYALRAGDEALRVFAARDAIVHYEAARDFLDGRADAQTWFLQLGRAYELVNAFARARGVYQEMLERGERANDAVMQAHALNRLALRASQDATDVRGAIELLERARGLAEGSGDAALLAETEWGLSQSNFHLWRMRAAMTHAEGALTFARANGDRDLSARSLNAMSLAGVVLGEWARVAEASQEAAELFAALGNRALQIDSLAQWGQSRVLCGFPREALEVGETMRALAAEIENPWSHILSDAVLGAAFRDVGELPRALEHAQRAHDLAVAHDIPILIAVASMLLGNVLRAQGEFARAFEIHQFTLATTERMDAHFTEFSLCELCADAARLEKWDAAFEYARRALEIRVYTYAPASSLTRDFEVDALLRGGMHAEATRDLAQFRQQIGTTPRMNIVYQRALAVMARHEGAMARAKKYMRAAEALGKELGIFV